MCLFFSMSQYFSSDTGTNIPGKFSSDSGGTFQAQVEVAPTPTQWSIGGGSGVGAVVGRSTQPPPQPLIAQQQLPQIQSPQQTFQQLNAATNNSTLPSDLENIAMPADQTLGDLDIGAFLSHELAYTNDNKLNFDIP